MLTRTPNTPENSRTLSFPNGSEAFYYLNVGLPLFSLDSLRLRWQLLRATRHDPRQPITQEVPVETVEKIAEHLGSAALTYADSSHPDAAVVTALHERTTAILNPGEESVAA